jgi:hypothetical protein
VLAGPASRVKAAVRAAFALHGPRAADRLSSNPQTVVDELLAAIAELEAAARRQHQVRRDQENHRQQQAQRERQARCQPTSKTAPFPTWAATPKPSGGSTPPTSC